MGVVRGVGSVVCRAEGTFMGFHWWAREHRVTSAEAKGGRPSLLSQQPINSGAENTVCLPRLLCFLLRTLARGVVVSLRQIIPGDCKKLPSLCLNIHIHCDLEKMLRAMKFMSAYNCISITKKLPSSATKNAEFNLSTSMGVHLMPGVLPTSCHLVFNLNPG